MRLISTPELPSDAAEAVLFLGAWCLSAQVAEAWRGRTFEVLPYHWADPRQVRHDYRKLDRFGERLLEALADRLNSIHGQRRSLRFWRIMAGRWITYAVPVLFDRYRSLLTAARDGRVTTTEIECGMPDPWIANSESEFLRLAIDDPYNRYLYGRIIRELDLLPFRARSATERLPPPGVHASPSRARLIALAGARAAAKTLPAALKRVAFWSAPIDRMDRLALMLRMGQFGFVLGPAPAPARTPVDWTARRWLSDIDLGTDDFAELTAALLPELVPRDLVEDFNPLVAAAERFEPRRPAVIVTGSVIDDSPGKMWTALNVERGTKLVVSQHGGNYGSGAFIAAEDHEIRCADAYFSWGWTRDDDQTVVPLPSTKLGRAARRIVNRSDGPVVLVLAAMPRYAYWLYAVPQAVQFEAYIDEQAAFVEALPPEIQPEVLVRLYPLDYGRGIAKRLSHLPVKLRTPGGKQSFVDDLAGARMMVGTYNATTFLETLAADYPTLLFWNFDQWPLRDAARPAFDVLVEAGILYDNPLAAARKLTVVFDDVARWWNSTEVQRARRAFVQCQARTSPRWAEEWCSALDTVRRQEPVGKA